MKKNILTFVLCLIFSMSLLAQKLEFDENPGKANEFLKLTQPEKVLLVFESELILQFKSSIETLSDPIKEGNTYRFYISQMKCVITIADQDNNKVDISFGNLGANFPPLNKGEIKYFEIYLIYPLKYIEQTEQKKKEGIIDNQMFYEKEALVFFTVDPPDMELQFSSSVEITEIKNEAGVYRLYLKPAVQTLTIKYPELDDTYIVFDSLAVKEVRYFYVILPNKFRNIQTESVDNSISVGSYRIETDPSGAVIEMYGNPAFNSQNNKTPFVFEGYETGAKILTLRLPEYETITDTIQIGTRRANKSKYELIPEFAFVNFNISPAPPYSKLFINDTEKVYFQNDKDYKVGKGDVSVVVEADHYYPASRIINTIAGKVHELSIALQPIMGRFMVEVGDNAEGANVYIVNPKLGIEKEKIGKLPFDEALVMQEGEYMLFFEKKDFATKQTEYTIEIDESKTTRFKADFNENRKISIYTTPDNATVFIDGEKVGRSKVSLDLTIGTHNLRLEKESYENLVEELIINRNSNDYYFNLEPEKILFKPKNREKMTVEFSNGVNGKYPTHPNIIYNTKGNYNLTLTSDDKKVFKGRVRFPQVNGHMIPMYSRNRDLVFSVLTYEYDYYLDSHVFGLGQIGLYGLRTTIVSLRTIETIDSRQTLVSPFLNFEFSMGGAVFRHLDLSLDLAFSLWGNFGEDDEKPEENKDQYNNMNYFGGIKLQTRGKNRGDIFSLYAKAGILYSEGEVKYVNSDFSYGPDFTFGPGYYISFTLGAKIVSSDNQMLRLWRKPIFTNLLY